MLCRLKLFICCAMEFTISESLSLFYKQTGAVSLLWLKAVDADVFANLRTVVMDDSPCSINCNVSVGYKPFFVAVRENGIERAVNHILYLYTLEHLHFPVAVTENKINPVPVFFKDQLNDAKCQRGLVHKGAFFKYLKRQFCFIKH